MRIEQVIKEYTPFLLKTAYLITRDRAKIEEIVEQTFIKFKVENVESVKASVIKSKLLEFLVKSLADYYKSWHYQKQLGKRIFDNGEQYIHPSFHDDLSYAILRLPLKLREATTLYFFAERTTADISRLLGVTQGTVQQRLLKAKKLINKAIFEEDVGTQTALIDAYLKEWDERAQYVEQKWIDKVEMIEVAPPNKKRKKMMLSIAVIGAAVLAIVISQFVTKNDKQLIDDQQQIGELVQTFVQDGFEIFPGAIQQGNVLVPPAKSLEIAKYYTYYNESINSLKYSEISGSARIYHYYYTLYMLEKNNYQLDMERVKFYQERGALTHRTNMEDPAYQTFIQILNEQHNITEQDVIDYFLVPQVVSTYFEEIFRINSFNDAGSLEEYYKIVGVDWEKQYEEYEKEQLALESKYELLNDMSKLPFEMEIDNHKFALDEEGQIIMLDPSLNSYFFQSNRIDEMEFYDLRFGFAREINRLSLPDFILHLEERFEGTNDELLHGYIEYCKIILRSIELDLD